MRGTEFSGQRRRGIDRVRSVVVLLVLCSSFFSSIGPGTRAQENDQPATCPEGQVYDEPTATCIEAPLAEDVPDEPEEPQKPLPTGSLTVSAYICDSDFDAASAGPADYFNNCGFPGKDIAFVVAASDGTGASGSTNGNGYLGFEDLNLDVVSITQSIPAGYSEPFVACAAGDGNTDYAPVGVYNGSSIDIDLAVASYYVCVWFNVPLPSITTTLDPKKTPSSLDPVKLPGTSDTLDPNKPPLSLDPVKLPGTSDTLDPDKPPFSLDPVALPTSIPVPGQSIHVVFRNCPASFDPEGKVIGDFWTACKEFPASSEVITLSLPDGTVQPDAWAGETAEFPNPPVGELTFNTTLQPGFTSRYIGCDITSFIQADLPMYEFVVIPPDGATYTFDYDLGPNRFTDCHIFNVRFDAAAEPAADGAAGLVASGGAVDVFTWSCPVDYDAGNAGYDGLVADCTTVMSNIQISAGTGDGEVATGVTGMDGPGMARFEDVSGEVSVVVGLPAGYGTPAVYCGAAGDVANVPVMDDSAFSLTVTGGERWSCDVFNTRVAP